MKKSMLSLIILCVIAFSQNAIYTVSGQKSKSKSTIEGSKSGVSVDQKSLNLINKTPGQVAAGSLIYDGRTYKTVIINGKEWMAENLAYLPFVNFPTFGSYNDPRYYVYDYLGNDVAEAKTKANYTTYGVLYNWPAAKVACPPGWHLPSDAEWTALENYLIANGHNFDGTTTGNKIAKSLAAGANWATTSIAGAPGNNLSLNNKSGFTALPNGYRFDTGVFGWIGESGFWWSSTEHSPEIAWSRRLFYNISETTRFYGKKEYGYSVRCVKD